VRIASVLFGALLAIVIPAGAHACACERRSAACEGYWTASAVFVGRVESVARVGNSASADRVITFRVLDAFKGVSARQVEIRNRTGACAYPFKQGREYFVYASRSEDGAYLTTTICSRTSPIEDAGTDLGYAKGMPDAPPLGRIQGHVTLTERDVAGRRVRDEPMRDVAVALEKDGTVLNAATDSGGTFVVDGLSPGTYQVRLALSERYYADVRPRDAVLLDVRGCAAVDVTVYHNGRVTGRVVDATRRPIAGLTLELAASTNAKRSGSERRRTITAADGRFQFARVPPGRFVIGAVPEPVFYPGVQPLPAATRVTVGAGELVSLPDFVMPAASPYVGLTGVVFDADGVPAEGARVFLMGVGERGQILAEPVLTDASGRFALAAPAHREYRVFAERERPGDPARRVEWSEQASLTAEVPSKPLRLTLRRRY
jgi:5-hydroxyisourate hydrolase-like protein (transthyretin family)